MTLKRLLLPVWLLTLTGTARCAVPPGATTVILIRHAERASLLVPDSPLSDQGRRRAAGLAYLLDQYRPVALFASDRIRTRQTLQPLSVRLHEPIQVWNAQSSASLGRFLRTAYRGNTVIVCWHHDHMAELAKALGVREQLPGWSLFTYDKVWTVTLGPGGQTAFQESREWGRP